MKVISFDPGNTTGIAVFDTETEKPYQPTHIAQPKGRMALFKELENYTDCQLAVIENYRIRPTVNHDWSSVDTLRLIGYIMYWCDFNNIAFKLQEPVDKVPGYGWAGLEYKKGRKGTHIQDAIAHGAFFLHKTLKMDLP